MLVAEQKLDLSPIGMVLHVVKTAKETKGASLEMEWELLPKADGTPLHIHPNAQECYHVLEGQMEINVNGKWMVLKSGESFTVPEGVPHTFRNPTNEIVRVYNTHTPALMFDQYFEGLATVVNKLAAGKQERLKMNFNAANHLAMLMKKYKAEIVSVNPPAFIINLLNIIGKIRGLHV
ncbi:cupin domain-containing protein [Pontibacter locisalis]|uniref:Cupin domain-containing protein n=1 Tax=Pontibacter locisalis TaxID=1719035 RepID=A0ABW5ISB3_9BACT